MKSAKVYVYGAVLAAPFLALLYYILHPPQCPPHYTQQQIDTSRCIVGANIGGMPLFIVLAIGTWLVATWLVSRLLSKRKGSR